MKQLNEYTPSELLDYGIKSLVFIDDNNIVVNGLKCNFSDLKRDVLSRKRNNASLCVLDYLEVIKINLIEYDEWLIRREKFL
jgi:hypothetical protein